MNWFRQKEPSREEIELMRSERIKLEEKAKTRKEYHDEKDRISQAKKDIRQNSGTYRGFQKVKEGFKTLKAKAEREGKNVPLFAGQGNKITQSYNNPFQQQQTFRNPTANDTFKNPFGNDTQATPKKKPAQNIRIVIEK